MVRRRKDTGYYLERMADQILLDSELAAGNVTSTKNRHGFGEAMREKGILTASHLSAIAAVEKTGWSEEQLDSAVRGLDRTTRQRYSKE